MRAISQSLPKFVPFWDMTLDVMALLDECDLAQKEDRPCRPMGDPIMVNKLAHIIRMYRGMDTSDKKHRLEICGNTHETGLVCSQKPQAHGDGFHYANSSDGKLHRWADEKGEYALSLGNSLFVQFDGGGGPLWALIKPYTVEPEKMTNEQSTWLALAAECDKRIDAGSVARWFRENGGPEELPKKVAGVMPGFCRWVVRKVAADMIEAARKENDEAMRLIRFALNEANYVVGKTPMVDMVRSIINENANIRRILREKGQLALHPKDDVLDIIEKMTNERSKLHGLLNKCGARPPRVKPNSTLVERLEAVMSDFDAALSRLDWPGQGTLVGRIASITQLIDAKDNALTAFWQDIRTIVGPVDATDADREAVTEEDAANGPDAREYYAERKALLRMVRENAEGIAELRRHSQAYSTPKQMAMDMIAAVKANHTPKVRDQFELELSEIRDVLSKAGHTVDTHAQLMGVLRSITAKKDDQTTPWWPGPSVTDQQKEADEQRRSTEFVWPQFSSLDTRISMPLLAKLAEMIGQPHEHGQPNMEARQNRIIRLARAVQALATSHGISSTSAAIVDQGSFE